MTMHTVSRGPVAALAVLIHILTFSTKQVQAAHFDLAIDNVTIVPATGEGPFLGSLAIADGRIVNVSTKQRVAGRVRERIDGTGLFLTPGLWDAHVHLASVKSGTSALLDLSQFTRHGVTSVRDLGGYPDLITQLRLRAWNDRQAPNIYSALATLNGQALAPFQRLIEREEDIEPVVAELAAQGADLIKIHRGFKPELLPALIAAAHARGLRVTGHIPLGLHPLRACEMGMDGIEHIGSFIEAYVSAVPDADSKSAIAYLLSDQSEPLYSCLVSRGVTVTPTLVLYPAVARSRSGNKEFSPEAQVFITNMAAISLVMYQRGIILLAGTDYADNASLPIAPGSALIDELEMLQSAGISPRHVLTIGTDNVAKTLGRRAVIIDGAPADFILMAENPDDDIAALKTIKMLILRGAPVRLGTVSNAIAANEAAIPDLR